MNYLKNKYILFGGIFWIIVILAIGGYFYFKYQNEGKTAGANAQVAAAAEVKKLVAEVGKLIDLPVGEDPTIATVTDISKLKDQPFFAKAKNGDKVLIYTNARKAILYDINLKKILDVAPLNIGTQSGQVASPSAKPKVSSP